MEEQPTAATSPTSMPKQSPRHKRQLPSPDPVESAPLGGTTPKATLGGPPAQRGKKSLPGLKHSSPAALRHLA